jgi:hypothetical protein
MLFELRAAIRKEKMLSPRFLRMQADKCLQSALVATDPDTAADLKKMARDLENWANEAYLEDKSAWGQPLLASTVLH